MSYKLTVISSGEPAMREVCRQLRNYLGHPSGSRATIWDS